MPLTEGQNARSILQNRPGYNELIPSQRLKLDRITNLRVVEAQLLDMSCLFLARDMGYAFPDNHVCDNCLKCFIMDIFDLQKIQEKLAHLKSTRHNFIGEIVCH